MSKKHTEIQFLPYSPRQLFDLVMDVEKYPEFLPWCSAARILSRGENVVYAELAINFKGFSTHYTSKIETGPDLQIKVDMVEGPFKYLQNLWQFEYEQEKNLTKIEFSIDFCFESILLQKMVGAVFDKALVAMITAFGKRAEKIYGI